MSNTTYRVFVEKLGASNPEQFVGDRGDVFYDPEGRSLRLSDGITPGGIVLGGGSNKWIRPADWLPMPTMTKTEEKFVGLFAVYDTPENFIALYFEGNYTVNWGDGNVEDFNSGDKAQHSYAWSNIDAGTLTTEGYRQVLVTVTPQSGQQLSIMDLSVRHDDIGFSSNPTNSPWLEIKVSMPNAASGDSLEFQGGRNPWGYLSSIQSIHIVNSGGMTDFSYRLASIYSLRSVSIDNSPNAETFEGLFDTCESLTNIVLSDTSSVNNMSYMFQYCASLNSVPLFDTSSVTTMEGMFDNCYALNSVPLFDTSSVTTMEAMFYYCVALNSVPLFDTSSVSNMSYIFDTCTSLQIGAMNGTSVNIDYSNCLLGRDAIVDIFNGLATVVSATINISNNYGTAALSPADLQIAYNKNWTVAT